MPVLWFLPAQVLAALVRSGAIPDPDPAKIIARPPDSDVIISMPFDVPAPAPSEIQKAKPPVKQKQPFVLPYDDVQVQGKTWTADTDRQILTYSDGVVTTYGPTIISSDRLEMHGAPNESFGIASGNVKLTDPEGIVTADKIEFHWKTRTGEADNAYILAAGYRLRAEHIDIQPEQHRTVTGKDGKPRDEVTPAKWTLTNVVGTNCARPNPVYEIHSRMVVIEPGRHGTAFHPVFYVLGKRIVELPTQRFSLDRRATGVGVPVPSLNREGRFGASWGGSLLLDDRTSMNFHIGMFSGGQPSGRVTVARSFVDPAINSSPIAPQSEFGERFRQGWFDNIRTQTFESEEKSYRDPRNSVSASSFLHITPSARTDTTHFDVPLELAAERSFKRDGWGFLGQVRAVTLHQVADQTTYRLNGQLAISPPRIKFGPGLFGISRFDASTFYGVHGDYSWARMQAGVLYEPNKLINFGAVYYDSVQDGHPEFQMDPLASEEGVNARVSLNLGSTQVSYILKYDRRKESMYDREYSVVQAIGCVDAFLIYRRFPNSYALGFSLRATDFFDRLHKRSIQRTPSPAPPGH